MAVKIEIKRHAAPHHEAQPVREEPMHAERATEAEHPRVEEKKTGYNIPLLKFDNNLWGKMQPYLDKNGRHFNDMLAGYAISTMQNKDKSKHVWSVADVKNAMEAQGLYIHKPYTYADAAYAANMAYADFYPTTLTDPAQCLQYAYDLCNDPDGYSCEVFNRWSADIYAKGIDLNWEAYV